jgi:hypothetical protein
MSASFRFYRGDTAAITLSFVQAEDTDSAYDLTGLTLTITANTERNPTTAAAEMWSVTMALVSAIGGTASFSLNATQADMTPGTYYFDVESVDGSAKIKTLFKGSFIVLQDINKA